MIFNDQLSNHNFQIITECLMTNYQIINSPTSAYKKFESRILKITRMTQIFRSHLRRLVILHLFFYKQVVPTAQNAPS